MICNECETVAHCTKHGCVPKQPSPVQQEPVAVVGEDKHGPFVDWLGDKSSFYERNPVGTKFYTTPPAQPAVPLTDEEIDAKFDAFASKFDHESNEWLDMGADAYFRAGFRAAHGITVTPEKGGTP
jgi:hypothetical protein